MDKKEQAYQIKLKLNKRKKVPSIDEAYIFINAIIGFIRLRAHYHDDVEAIRLVKTAELYGW